MNKNELRVLKYRTIVNKTHDVELAKRARNWGEKRIYKELGITLPKTIPKLRKNVSRKWKQELKRRQKKFKTIKKTLINNGISENEAVKIASNNKKKSYKKIKQVLSKYNTGYGGTPIRPKEPQDIIGDYNRYSFDEKVIIWSKWAKAKKYPKEIEKLAHSINKEKGLDVDHNLGWYVVYQSFLYDEDINKLKEHISIMPYQPDMYVDSDPMIG